MQADHLPEPEESQNRKNHNDHADQPKNIVHGPPTLRRSDRSLSRTSETAHMPRKAARRWRPTEPYARLRRVVIPFHATPDQVCPNTSIAARRCFLPP